MAKIECLWELTAIDFIPVALQYEDLIEMRILLMPPVSMEIPNS